MELIAAIVGALLAILGGYWAQSSANKRQEKEAREKREADERALISVLDTEIRMIWRHYCFDIGLYARDMGGNRLFTRILPINGGYFRVFKGVVAQIGMITDDGQRDSIVDFYVKAEAMIGAVRQNNDLALRWRTNDMYSVQRDELHEALIASSDGLQFSHNDLFHAARAFLGDDAALKPMAVKPVEFTEDS